MSLALSTSASSLLCSPSCPVSACGCPLDTLLLVSSFSRYFSVLPVEQELPLPPSVSASSARHKNMDDTTPPRTLSQPSPVSSVSRSEEALWKPTMAIIGDSSSPPERSTSPQESCSCWPRRPGWDGRTGDLPIKHSNYISLIAKSIHIDLCFRSSRLESV